MTETVATTTGLPEFTPEIESDFLFHAKNAETFRELSNVVNQIRDLWYSHYLVDQKSLSTQQSHKCLHDIQNIYDAAMNNPINFALIVMEEERPVAIVRNESEGRQVMINRCAERIIDSRNKNNYSLPTRTWSLVRAPITLPEKSNGAT